MRRATTSVVTTGAGIGAIVVGLAVIDERVRAEIGGLISGRGAPGQIVSAGERVQDLGLVALHAVRDQSIEHAPLTLFALVALVLFALMLRS
jgi:hypothetical protein